MIQVISSVDKVVAPAWDDARDFLDGKAGDQKMQLFGIEQAYAERNSTGEQLAAYPVIYMSDSGYKHDYELHIESSGGDFGDPDNRSAQPLFEGSTRSYNLPDEYEMDIQN